MREIRVALPGKAQQPQDHCYPFLPVCSIFVCPDSGIQLPVFGIFRLTGRKTPIFTYLGFLTCTQMLHAVAHGGCADTVMESALKVYSGLFALWLESASVLRLAFQPDALRTELFHGPKSTSGRVE